jgi:hypothetical protein
MSTKNNENNSILSTTTDTNATNATTVSTAYPAPSHISCHSDDSPKIAHASLDSHARSVDTSIASPQSTDDHEKISDETNATTNAKVLPTQLDMTAIR